MQGLHPQDAYQDGIGPGLGRNSLTEGSKLRAQPRDVGRRHPVVLEPERQHAVSRDVRRLLVHQAEGFAESGLSISVRYYPTPRTPLGFTARVAPAGGDARIGTWPGSGTGASA